MPMHTIHRDPLGSPVPKPYGWGVWHLARFGEAMEAEYEESTDPDETGPRWFPDSYTFRRAHTFTDPDDGETFFIFPGDTYETSR